jgi:hypothetical protein
VGGATHFDLLNHHAVYEQIHRWLAAGAPRLPAPCDGGSAPVAAAEHELLGQRGARWW